ncbi:MAG: fluoride efflux transporter CrcB [Pseudomonadota bacterium]
MQVMPLIYVMTGGAIGSALRYLMMSFIGRLIVSPFPYGTLAVNVLGSFVMGVWIAVMAHLLPERSRDLHLLFAVGVLGGFTTFSTFSLDIFYLFERTEYSQAAIYIISSVLVSVVALVFGMWLVGVSKI